jgi:hypothetical protein
MTRLGPAVLAIGVFGAFGVSRPAAAQPPACKPVNDAMLKVVTTPHHAVVITDQSERIELIVVDNTSYVQIKGTWSKSPMSLQVQLQQEQENIKNVKVYTCTPLRSETVNGIAAVAYKVHSETPDVGNSDGTVWIAPSLGLPVQSDEDVTPIMGSKMHNSVTWDYKDIRAPVVK